MKKLLTTASLLAVALTSTAVFAQRAPVRTGTRVLERPRTEERGRTTIEVARPTAVAPKARQADVRADAAPKTVVNTRSAVGTSNTRQQGPQCQVDNYGGVSIRTALSSGTAGATACATDLSTNAKHVAGVALNKADATRQAFGLRSSSQGTIGQRAEIVQSFARSLDEQSDALNYNQALHNTAEICGKCGILGASLCNSQVLKAAGAIN